MAIKFFIPLLVFISNFNPSQQVSVKNSHQEKGLLAQIISENQKAKDFEGEPLFEVPERGHTKDFKVPEKPKVVKITNADGLSLRHSHYKIWANSYDGHDDFKWRIRGALNSWPNAISFESINFNDHYLARDA